MAGLGEVCSHVAAILFYLESASRVSATCTQISCAWKEPRLVETIPYARIMDIPFTKPKGVISASCNRKRGAHLYSDSLPISDLPQFPQAQLQEASSVVELIASTSELGILSHNSNKIEQSSGPESSQLKDTVDYSFFELLQIPPSDEEKLAFLTENERFDPVVNSIVSPLSEKFKTVSPVVNMPSPLRDLYRPQNEELTYPELMAVCEQVTLTISDDEIKTIEAATRNQSKSTAWFIQRAGRITASLMKQVCATDPGNPSQSRICYPELALIVFVMVSPHQLPTFKMENF